MEITLQDDRFEMTLLHLAKCLTFVQAEKVAVQLRIDHAQISMLRRVYMEDSDMFAYRLLQKWWNACELDEIEAKNELSEALKYSNLAGLARTTLHGIREEPQTEHLLSVVENLTHIQVERVAIALGVRPSMIDSLRKMYSEDPQLFGFHVLSHWRNSCELDQDQQREKLELVLASSLVSTSFHEVVDYANDSEVDFSRVKRKSYCAGCCKRYCLWIIIFLFLFIFLLISSCSIPVLLTVPSLNDYTISIYSGDVILLPVSRYITGINLRLGSQLACTGKAMALDCNDIQPHFELKNTTRQAYIYMAIGSIFQITLIPPVSTISLHTTPLTSFLWIFDNYKTYAGALSNNFQGYDCANPGDGNWCYHINTAVTSLATTVHDYINYTVTKNSYYHVACYPDDLCPLIKFQIFRGSFSFSSFDSKPHSYAHLNEEEQVKVIIKSQFDYSQESKCVLVQISNDYQVFCQGIIKLLITNQNHHTGLLLFPGLVIFSILLCSIVYLMCVCHRIRKSNCSFRTNHNESYQLVDIST